jgi:hypothetical protein
MAFPFDTVAALPYTQQAAKAAVPVRWPSQGRRDMAMGVDSAKETGGNDSFDEKLTGIMASFASGYGRRAGHALG